MKAANIPLEDQDSFDALDESFYENHPAPPTHSRMTRLLDWWVGVREKRSARSQGPSSRAWEEMLSYYNGLYQSHGPDPVRFERLLLRNGVPVWPNPFPEGVAQHFDFHPDGLLLSDLEAILEDLSDFWHQQEPGEEDSPVVESNPAYWPQMQEILHLQEIDRLRCRREWRKIAGVCWGLALIRMRNTEWIETRVHADNLTWATIHALKTAPWKTYGVSAKEVLEAAIRLNLLPDTIAEDLRKKIGESSEAKPE